MVKKFIFLFLIGQLSANAFACLNEETKKFKNGTPLYRDTEVDFLIPRGHQFVNINNRTIREFENLYRQTKNVDYLSDKGYILIVQEKYQEAIKLYLSIEKLQPNRYATSANLGTAYELEGDNINALKWLKKAVEIDPSSHENSEWVHLKILEAKIKVNQPITDLALIASSFGSAPHPQSSLSLDSLSMLRKHIFYQLKERMSLVKPKDQFVAQLLFELGNLNLLLKQPLAALEIYKEAKRYGFSGLLLQQRQDIAEGKKPRTIMKESKDLSWIYWMSGILIASISFFFWMKNKKR